AMTGREAEGRSRAERALIADTERRHAALVRDIFGGPLRAGAVDRACLTPTVLELARTAYDERDPCSGELDLARLAVLSDALEDAGCADAAILEHLRGVGPHVRGCWPLDLLLTSAA